MLFKTNLIYLKTETYKTKDGDYAYRHILVDSDGNRYTLFTDVDSWQARHGRLEQFALIPVDVIVYKKDNAYQLQLKECADDEW